MTIKTKQSINGFIASDPQLTFPNGKARLYARIGINHHEAIEGGKFRDLEPTFHDLVMFGTSAERASEVLRKGDYFIAQGSVRTFPREVDGIEEEAEQFVAKRIGHDNNLTTYTVQRRRQTTPPAPASAASVSAHHPPTPPPPPPAGPVGR